MNGERPEPVLIASGALGGTRWVYRFPNGWGASVIRGTGTYGTELCVSRPVSEDPDDFYLVEDDPLNDGWLSEDAITDRLLLLAGRSWAGPPDLSRRWQPAIP